MVNWINMNIEHPLFFYFNRFFCVFLLISDKLQSKYSSNTAMIPTTNRLDTSIPPAFSRLPPDGHEFPPNFIEPIILSQADAEMLRKHSHKAAISDKILNG